MGLLSYASLIWLVRVLGILASSDLPYVYDYRLYTNVLDYRRGELTLLILVLYTIYSL